MTHVYLLEVNGVCVQNFLDLGEAKACALERFLSRSDRAYGLIWFESSTRERTWDLFTRSTRGNLMMINISIRRYPLITPRFKKETTT